MLGAERSIVTASSGSSPSGSSRASVSSTVVGVACGGELEVDELVVARHADGSAGPNPIRGSG
jgi:hypothetical protein